MRPAFFLLVVIGFLTAVLSLQHQPPATLAQIDKPTLASTDADSPFQWQLLPQAIQSGSDECNESTTVLNLSGGGEGDNIVTNNYTRSATDPQLSCMWGNPADTRGWRTVWYKFVAPETGYVQVSTFDSTYDTVVAIHQGNNCGALTTLSCNDDYQGFTSYINQLVFRNQTYYIEVADWQIGGSGEARLRLAVTFEPTNTLWQTETSLPQSISLHTTVIADDLLYVIGGQTGDRVDDDVVDLSPAISRYNPANGSWEALRSMPGFGYANTTSAYLSYQENSTTVRRIYLPSGHQGSNEQFSGKHLIYDIDNNVWFDDVAQQAPWPSGIPFAWSAAVTHPTQPVYFLTGGASDPSQFENTDSTIYNTFFRYSAIENNWQTLPTMSRARYAHTAAWVDGEVCVVGGLTSVTGQGSVLTDGECFNFITLTWEPIGSLNRARYNAGSAVSPNGDWYIFGGADAQNDFVTLVERFDPVSRTWIPMGASYALGGLDNLVPRAWPRGGFVGDYLYVTGGHTEDTAQPLPFVERLFLTDEEQFLPLTVHNVDILSSLPNETFAQATDISLNSETIGKFERFGDFFNVYHFTLTQFERLSIQLNDIPSNSDYDLFVYDEDKLLWAFSKNLQGVPESISNLILNDGDYYLVVQRQSPRNTPNPAPYTLILRTD